ncbi:MAG: methyltransferase domain-containing protein [Pseudomonadota bacterium]
MAWCNALLRLPRISFLQQQVHELTARLDQLQQTHHTLLHSHEKLKERVTELDEQKVVTRLQRYDALDIGTRLMKLDRMQIARQLKTVNQLMRENQNEDIRKQAREQALLARIDAFERLLREHGAPPLDAFAGHLPVAPAAADTGFDQDKFYVEFEALFRGTREDIKERLKAYLPYLEHITALPALQRLKVIDVGCGRGEWLELMDEQDIPAIGVDMNATMVDACLEQGFAARCDDAIAYLREQEAGSVAAVTGFHIIEHLPFETLIALFDAALHALCPGGVIIFETPNPENLMVGACNFYYDPTHLHPIVPQVAEFMARQRGFSHAEILRLHPYPDNHLLHGGTEVEAAVNKVLFGPQDYAVIGRK